MACTIGDSFVREIFPRNESCNLDESQISPNQASWISIPIEPHFGSEKLAGWAYERWRIGNLS